ncbi:MAG: hypothetical protein AAGH41_08280 [Pseudomonadota bacterium]
MADKHAKRMDAWEKLSAKGFWHFVLMRGVLGWGAVMFVLMTGGRWVTSDEQLSPEFIAFSAVLWTCGGLVWGVLTYKLTEWGVRRRARQET